ncbi:hypothetical protein HOA59_03470 [archaeon]|jgi:hypothetical protein|nr:hypothetical protein [archaeon]MBT6824458.1 hypothetical protein [archaeon]MBT7106843.1 hypothetical protein [archaeon]MBT7297807.1 hypothetical protein [archaeon]
MKLTNKKVGIGAIIVITILILIFSSQSKDYEEFANCLTQKGVSMAGTEWCSHCKTQKEMFGESFQYIDYHNCDLEREWCMTKGIQGYPSWVLPNGELLPGTQTLSKLAELSNCSI